MGLWSTWWHISHCRVSSRSFIYSPSSSSASAVVATFPVSSCCLLLFFSCGVNESSSSIALITAARVCAGGGKSLLPAPLFPPSASGFEQSGHSHDDQAAPAAPWGIPWSLRQLTCHRVEQILQGTVFELCTFSLHFMQCPSWQGNCSAFISAIVD